MHFLMQIDSLTQKDFLAWEDSLLGQYQDGALSIPEGTDVEVKKNENGNYEFTAQPGYVYLVQGQWEQGTVEYGFRVGLSQ